MPELRFLIWSNEYRCFWGGPGQGNTWTLSQAGRYTEAEARSVCDRANAGLPAGEEPKEVMLLAPECLGMVTAQSKAVTKDEARQQAWELVNQFVIACGEINKNALNDSQMQKAMILVDWTADAIFEASNASLTTPTAAA